MSDFGRRPQSAEPKTVLYVHHGRGLGGAPLSLLYIIQRLDQRRYRPVVLCLYDSEVVPHFRKHGVEVHVCKGVRELQHTTAGWFRLYSLLGLWGFVRSVASFLPSVWKTKRLVQYHGAALVHLNSLTLAPSALGARLAGVPVVWHVRESVVKGHLGIRRALLRWMVERFTSESIFICNNSLVSLGAHHNGTTIYNFVDFERWDRTLSGAPARAELGIPAEAKVVLLLGGVSRIKGTLELVQAMARVRREVPQALALIAGGVGPASGGLRRLSSLASHLGRSSYGQQVRRAVAQSGLDGVVQFIPFRTDAEQLIAAADVVAVPTIEPHFARPVIEAGAMAKPVVASRIGGVEEVVQDGETGLLVPPGDPNALATALSRVLTVPDLASRLGEEGYEQARRMFDAETNITQVVEVYERVLARKDAEPSLCGVATK